MTKEKLEDYFRLQKTVLKVMGISLYENDSIYYKLYSYFCVIFIVCLYTGVEVYDMYVFRDDMDVLASIFGIAATHILGIGKVILLLKNREQIRKTLKTLETGIFAPNIERGGEDEFRWISVCITANNRQSTAYFSPIVVAWIIILAGTVTKRLKSNDYRDWQAPGLPLAFELKKSPDFEIVAATQAICLLVFALIISSIDLIIVGMISHIRVQFMLLKNAIGRMVKDASKLAVKDCRNVDVNINSSIPPKYLHHCLRKVVIYHQSIIDLAHQFEEQFNFMILMVFLTNTFTLCFTMYHASLYPLSDPRILQDLLISATTAFQVFLYCYWGNELTLESQKVASACYEVNFTGTDVAFQKDLVTIIQRSQKPITITAAKFTNLSLLTFVGILRLSYSYYMVLRQSNDRK